MFLSNRRRVARFPFHSRAIMHISSGQLPCLLVDLSLRGALLESCETITEQPGGPCLVEIIEARNRKLLQTNAQLIHVSDKLAGVKFSAVDEQALSALMRIARLNLAPYHLIGRDVPALLRRD